MIRGDEEEGEVFERLLEMTSHPLWRPWVDEVWVARPGDLAQEALILPDNCMDIVWRDGRAQLVGASTQAFFALDSFIFAPLL